MKPCQGAGRGELRSVWRRVLELGDRDRLELHRLLVDHLALGPGDAVEAPSEVEELALTLDDMTTAAEHLGLAPGVAPGYEASRDAAVELGLSFSASQIRRRWGKRAIAANVFIGGRTELSPRQRQHARATAGRDRAHEDYISGLRTWLDEQPAVVTRLSYDDFVEGCNRGLADEQAPLVKANAIQAALGIGWDALLSVARGELDLDAALDEARDPQRGREVKRGS